MNLSYRNMNATFSKWKPFDLDETNSFGLIKLSKNTSFKLSDCKISYIGNIFSKFSVKLEDVTAKDKRIYLIGSENEGTVKDIFIKLITSNKTEGQQNNSDSENEPITKDLQDMNCFKALESLPKDFIEFKDKLDPNALRDYSQFEKIFEEKQICIYQEIKNSNLFKYSINFDVGFENLIFILRDLNLEKKWDLSIEQSEYVKPYTCYSKCLLQRSKKVTSRLFTYLRQFILSRCLYASSETSPLYILEKSIESLESFEIPIGNIIYSIQMIERSEKSTTKCALLGEILIYNQGKISKNSDQWLTTEFLKQFLNLGEFAKTFKKEFKFDRYTLISIEDVQIINEIGNDDKEFFEMMENINNNDEKFENLENSDSKGIDQLLLDDLISKLDKEDYILNAILNKHIINYEEAYSSSKLINIGIGLTPEWYRIDNGIESNNKKNQESQRKILKDILKKLGKAIFSSISIMNISLPVIIFDKKSLLQRLFEKNFSAVHYFKGITEKSGDQEILNSGLKFLLTSCTMGLEQLKPFNPIIGETAQFWIEGCPFYLEQISHHPPISAFLLIGPNFRMHGSIEFQISIHFNSISVYHLGQVTVEFPNLGKTMKLIFPEGLVEGLLGKRKISLLSRSFIFLKESNILADITFDAGKVGFFKSIFSKKVSKDFFIVKYFEVKPEITQYLLNLKDPVKYTKLNLKSLIIKELIEGSGIWHTEFTLKSKNPCIWKNETIPKSYYIDENPLPSDSCFRKDLIYWICNDEKNANYWKEELENEQRENRRLREKFK